MKRFLISSAHSTNAQNEHINSYHNKQTKTKPRQVNQLIHLKNTFFLAQNHSIIFTLDIFHLRKEN